MTNEKKEWFTLLNLTVASIWKHKNPLNFF